VGVLLSVRNSRKEDTYQVEKRLNAIINILLETTRVNGKPLPVAKQIELLHKSGLRPIEIAKILGKSLANISVQLGRTKKAGLRK